MHTIQIVVDRLVAKPDMARRRTDSLETALALADGVAEIQIVPRDREPTADDTLTFSQHFACPTCGMSFQDLAPRNFSFNSPYGACQACDGLGTRYEVDPNLVVPDPDLPVDEGAIAPWAGGHSTYFHRLVEAVMSEVGSRPGTPWKDLTKKQTQKPLYGQGVSKVPVTYKNRYGRTRTYNAHYEGDRQSAEQGKRVYGR